MQILYGAYVLLVSKFAISSSLVFHCWTTIIFPRHSRLWRLLLTTFLQSWKLHLSTLLLLRFHQEGEESCVFMLINYRFKLLFPYLSEYALYVTCRFCELIGRLPLYLHGNVEQRCDHDQLNGTINGHLLLQKAGLLVPTLETMVSRVSWRLYMYTPRLTVVFVDLNIIPSCTLVTSLYLACCVSKLTHVCSECEPHS